VDASRGFEVELRQVGAREHVPDALTSASTRRPLLTWLLVLGSVAGVAVLGRVVGAGPDARPIQDQRAPAHAIAAADPSRAPVTAPVREIVVLASPAAANATITTRDLTIRGYLATGAGTIVITLEARGNRIIESTTIEPSLVFGERPTVGRHAQFETRFGLPNPRPNGRMIVQVALVDESGQIIDVIRRPIRVGPLLEGSGT
jgi:hypothetical protein